MDYVYKFPVVRGIQAKREYFIAMVPLKMLPRLFPIDDEYVLPEYRAQRKLNEARIPVISKYILDNRDSYVFSALAASIDGEFCFKADNSNQDAGTLEVSMDAKFLINDGQHRKDKGQRRTGIADFFFLYNRLFYNIFVLHSKNSFIT